MTFLSDQIAKLKQPCRTWYAVDESSDPADKSDRWHYGRFHFCSYTHIPEGFQKKFIEGPSNDDLLAKLMEILSENISACCADNCRFPNCCSMSRERNALNEIAAELERRMK